MDVCAETYTRLINPMACIRDEWVKLGQRYEGRFEELQTQLWDQYAHTDASFYCKFDPLDECTVTTVPTPAPPPQVTSKTGRRGKRTPAPPFPEASSKTGKRGKRTQALPLPTATSKRRKRGKRTPAPPFTPVTSK